MISVIVPVYNTEPYLRRCVDSILSQTFTDFELLLIDDGSTDRSDAICDEYAVKDERVRVFHKENGGVSSARNLGLDEAKGEWITFVDSDDELLKNALDILYSNISSNAALIISNTRFEGFISRKTFINELFMHRLLSLCGNLYKKSVLIACQALNISPQFILGEDFLGNLKIALKTERIYCIKNNIYLYRENLKSVTHTKKYTLKIQEAFLDEIIKMMGDDLKEYEVSWYKFRLKTLEQLIASRVKISYDRPWIKQLVKQKIDCKLTMGGRIVKSIHSPIYCWFLFLLKKRLWVAKNIILKVFR